MFDPLLYFWLVLKGSLFSTGGLGNLPSIHADLTARGWAEDQQFAEALAVGQVSPGPSGLWVISLGFLVDGLRGALLAFVAITLPPWGVLLVDRLYRRYGNHPAIAGFVRGLGLVVVGTFLVAIGRVTGQDLGLPALLIILVTIILGRIRRLPVIVVLALAALAGMLLY